MPSGYPWKTDEERRVAEEKRRKYTLEYGVKWRRENRDKIAERRKEVRLRATDRDQSVKVEYVVVKETPKVMVNPIPKFVNPMFIMKRVASLI
jgi:hypothetical protein